MLDYNRLSIISAMHDLMAGVFEHIYFTSILDIGLRIKYTERILRVSALNKFLQVLLECKESSKRLYGDQWSLGSAKNVTMEQLWTWYKVDATNGTGYTIIRADHCTYFEKELWLDLGKSMWSKNR